MEQIRIFSDKRLEDHCTYCGDVPSTRDHIPSKILLDLPYPENLPVVPACFKCNNGFSMDEEYFACMLECAICGTTEIDKLQRVKIKALLEQNQSLHLKLTNAKILVDGKTYFEPELARIKNVVFKHAKGIVKYETSESALEDPLYLNIKTTSDMTENESERFYSLSNQQIFPEIGSRAFQKAFRQNNPTNTSWTIVQDGIFKYTISVSNGITVKFLIREYLACEAHWE